jgi:excisionase family DNA binding protein
MDLQDEQLLTVRDVARRCRRSEETIRRWIWSGKLPARKLGNQLFVESGDVPERSVLEGSTSDRNLKPTPFSRQQMLDWLARFDRLRKRMFKKYGYFDVAGAVRRGRDSH